VTDPQRPQTPHAQEPSHASQPPEELLPEALRDEDRRDEDRQDEALHDDGLPDDGLPDETLHDEDRRDGELQPSGQALRTAEDVPPPQARKRTPAAGRSRRVMPRPRVMLGSLVLVLFVGVLVVQAYINAEFTNDHVDTPAEDQGTVPPDILTGGPIINTTGGQANSYRLPPKTIALTFDDGPDATWSPKILDVLEEYNAHATFFVVGSQVARHPDVVRDMAAGGHELGVHTFTHPNLIRLAPWRRKLEYAQTQLAIAQAAGVKTSLIRFPYSSKASAIDDVNWPLVKEAGKLGYLVIVNDTDSEDWRRPGVDQIISHATPLGDSSAVMLFHDAGGDRSQTVAALRQFIPMMQARGYRFTTVSEGLNIGLAEQSTAATGLVQNPQAAPADVWRGTFLLWTVRIADGTVYLLAGLFILVGALTVGRTALLLLLATRHARQRRKPGFTWGPPVTEPVSVIVPAYNEKEGIEAAVRSLAGGDYPAVEVVVVDDGSSDDTAALAEGLRLPNVRVVRTPNGGKANALNTGVALARHNLIVMVDGDTIFEPDSIRQLVQPFADPSVGAVAGNVKVGNRASLVASWQHIEYVIGFNLDRRLYEVLRCMPTVPGAIGAFRRSALKDVGGISDETLAEDTDVTMAMCRAGWQVVYEERARAWTEAPATLEQLYRQRYRWSYGTMQAMWKHRRALLDSGESGRFGRRGLPFLALFGVALPLLAPVVDIMLVYGLVFFDRSQTVVAWLAMLALQMITALVAFRFDSESVRPLWKLPLQQFAYRQLMYLVLIQSAMTAMTGGRLRWHKLHRAGLEGSAGSMKDGAVPVTDENLTESPTVTDSPAFAGPAALSGSAALIESTAEQPLVRPVGESKRPIRSANSGRAKVPGQAVAPVIDSWPSILSRPPVQHPAAGRATARPATARTVAESLPGQATVDSHGPGSRTAEVKPDKDEPVVDPAAADLSSVDGVARDLPPLDRRR
jgi:cellulose synthase/poly-beta-1,6-N-acetylglucosamine synthase-like glycosyltransferase/peptidoglycan/xylan/chitin deacetylase (PgdA/CDA1 family)